MTPYLLAYSDLTLGSPTALQSHYQTLIVLISHKQQWTESCNYLNGQNRINTAPYGKLGRLQY